MGKISRADWAASCPWDGITGKPASFGPTDISQLTANGYSNGQVPGAVAGRFRPLTLPTPTPAPTPTPTPGIPSKIWVSWDAPSIEPLQSAYEDFEFAGATPGMAVCAGAPLDQTFVNVSAYCFESGSVRIVVTNMSRETVDLGVGSYQLVIFP